MASLYMALQVTLHGSSIRAEWTTEWPFARVCPDVPLKVCAFVEAFLAERTAVHVDASVVGCASDRNTQLLGWL